MDAVPGHGYEALQFGWQKQHPELCLVHRAYCLLVQILQLDQENKKIGIATYSCVGLVMVLIATNHHT